MSVLAFAIPTIDLAPENLNLGLQGSNGTKGLFVFDYFFVHFEDLSDAELQNAWDSAVAWRKVQEQTWATT